MKNQQTMLHTMKGKLYNTMHALMSLR